jgi:cytochrome c biogenesis protein CcmG, thiol:disulfide interchange protein DsbE
MRDSHATARLLTTAILACALGIAGCGSSNGDSGAGNPESAAVDYKQALADAPPPLAKLYADGDALIPGGVDELHSQLAALRGHPVVVNAWASWCGPCRFEFPVFQKVAAAEGDRVAFLGVDSYDDDAAAETFLEELPLPYPSVTDPDKQIFDEWDLRGLPATAFYDSSGERAYVRPGPYSSEDDLIADIRRYAH